MQTPYVTRVDSPEGVATITFYHPKHNALTGSLLGQLSETITAAGADAGVQVMVLKSGGDRTFCAGASFDELVGVETYEEGKEFFSGFARVINACRTCGKLMVGRVQGKAIGGGVGMAAAVDYCLATRHASVKLSELSVGIGPFVVGPAVERKMGLAALSELTLKGDAFKPASWACERGLYAEVYEEVEAMDAAVDDLTSFLVQTNPEARSELKRVFWEGCEDWDSLLMKRAELSGRLVLSDFTRKALDRYR